MITEPVPSVCPYLGLAGEPTLVRTGADVAHRCYAQQPPTAPDLAHQAALCLSAAHGDCGLYVGADRSPAPAKNLISSGPKSPVSLLPWIVVVALALIVIAIYARDLLRPAALIPTEIPAPTLSAALPAIQATPSPSPSPSPGPAAAAPLPAPTMTPEPGGRVLVLTPAAEDAGWFASGEARGNHLGDSFLYAGYFGGQAFISAVRIELESAPRGAPIREATLRLTGLNDDRFDAAAGGAWAVQLLAPAALSSYTQADFQMIFNAPAAVTLAPALYPADLISGRPNTWVLDEIGRAWLAQQLLDGAESLVARMTGPSGGSDTLFAWDSGAGPATLGQGPQLVLRIGAAPPTPPPLPTEAVIVATLTATPANVLTAAVEAWTATAVARTTGAYTPLPYRVVTPTPSPANLATVQARALLAGLPAVVPHTPTPANQATVDFTVLLATAQAFLTGTPTATPLGAVTPVVLTPTPQPANVFTAAARYLAATASAAELGTATPWPYNAVIATSTPVYVVITDTPRPANAATATAIAAYATAVSLVVGTFTPLPPDWVTPTPPDGPATRPQASTAPAALAPNCPDPRAQITSPTPGQIASAILILRGTAIHEAFNYAKLEVATGSPPAGEYIEFGRFTFQIPSGRLGWLETAPLPNGPYTLRLTVVDRAGNESPACEVTITIFN